MLVEASAISRRVDFPQALQTSSLSVSFNCLPTCKGLSILDTRAAKRGSRPQSKFRNEINEIYESQDVNDSYSKNFYGV
jgi:hypothetical protein